MKLSRSCPPARSRISSSRRNKVKLVGILTYHVIPGKVMAADIAGKKSSPTTVQGTTVDIDATSGVKVDGGDRRDAGYSGHQRRDSRDRYRDHALIEGSATERGPACPVPFFVSGDMARAQCVIDIAFIPGQLTINRSRAPASGFHDGRNRARHQSRAA